jgi:hypothetical protein
MMKKTRIANKVAEDSMNSEDIDIVRYQEADSIDDFLAKTEVINWDSYYMYKRYTSFELEESYKRLDSAKYND